MQWQLPHLANDCMFGRDRPNNDLPPGIEFTLVNAK